MQYIDFAKKTLLINAGYLQCALRDWSCFSASLLSAIWTYSLIPAIAVKR